MVLSRSSKRFFEMLNTGSLNNRWASAAFGSGQMSLKATRAGGTAADGGTPMILPNINAGGGGGGGGGLSTPGRKKEKRTNSTLFYEPPHKVHARATQRRRRQQNEMRQQTRRVENYISSAGKLKCENRSAQPNKQNC